MKKLFAIIILFAGLAACNEAGESSTNASGDSSAVPPPQMDTTMPTATPISPTDTSNPLRDKDSIIQY